MAPRVYFIDVASMHAFVFHAKYLSVRYFENAVKLMSDGNLQVSTRAQGKTNYRDITLSKSLVILLRYVWVCWGANKWHKLMDFPDQKNGQALSSYTKCLNRRDCHKYIFSRIREVADR